MYVLPHFFFIAWCTEPDYIKEIGLKKTPSKLLPWGCQFCFSSL